jgi:hypothetical protein
MRLITFRTADQLVEQVNGLREVTSAVVVDGGSGYAVDDIVDVVGGTGGLIARLKVTGVSVDAITTVSVEHEGAYITEPANPVGVTGPGDDNATFTLTVAAAPVAQANIASITNKKGSWYLQYWT